MEVVTIENEMRQSYMDYAMSVIVGRALPDIRDGLKPVQRRVLYAMLVEGLVSNRKHSKCAGVVGSVLKLFHPHGDSPVYEALVRLAQPWNLRYTLVDGQGNFGSIDGDPPAAYRYTECRMTSLAEKLLEDIDKDTVDFTPNFDESTDEPVVLPSVVPNLLINGADGIAVGMATHIPPHNLSEVVDGTVALIENPKLTVQELMTHIPGPDFPTGGIIHGRKSIISAYSTGKGIVQIRAKAHFEELKGKSKDVTAIVITEIPYQVNKSRLLEKIAELVTDKSIEGIARIRDESDRKGMRIVIELKRDATPEVVLNQLYKTTPLQSSFGIINLAVVEGRPEVLSLIDMLRYFLDHRRDVITRRTQHELKKAKERLHILEGFRIALLNLDEVIELIKKAKDPKEAKDVLISRFELSEKQAQAILELRLQRLTGMERLAIEKEFEELLAEVTRLEGILADPKKVDNIIKLELLSAKEQYGDARRTELKEELEAFEARELIEDEEMVVTITHAGYIKRTAASEYRAQRRGGKGVSGGTTREDDFVEHLFTASSLADLLFFTSSGRLYWKKVYEIPETGRTSKGRALVNLLNIKTEETVTAILPVKEFVEGKYVFMTTKDGVVKRTDLMEFSRARKSGIIACTLADNDKLISAAVTSGSDEVILATKSGMSIRFGENDVRSMGRSARGVTGIRFHDNTDAVVSMTIVPKGTEEEALTLLTACENGYGKRTKISQYRLQGRGGKGVIDIQTTDRNGPVISAYAVDDSAEAMLITSSGKIIRMKSKDISVIGRNTQGVKLIDLDEGEKVVAISPLIEEE